MQQKFSIRNNKAIVKSPELTVLLLILLTLSSCKKFVSVDPPVTKLVSASVFSNNQSATAAQIAIYQQMLDDGYTIAMNSGLSGDELTNYSSSPQFQQLYTNSLIANNLLNDLYSRCYKYIYQANAIIEGLQNTTGVSVAVKQQITGESKFMRAFFNFYLVNLYGDIPLSITTDYKVNSVAARTAKTQIYQQIISDLKDAQTLLNNNYVDATSISTTSERIRPTKGAAIALLARAYLYQGDWSNAEVQSSALISNNNLYRLEANLNKVFLANSSETIWQLYPTESGHNTPDGLNWILTGAPSSGSGGQNTTISSQLLGAFEPGDNRRSNWIHDTTILSVPYAYPFKYKVTYASAISEYVMVFRLAEQYLIRAEARVQQGTNISGAIADLNAIRNRAGLPNYAGTQATLLNAILHERQVELFTEWGQRWFDLKRTGNVNSVMSVVTPFKGGIWNSNWQLYPIPQTEITNNPNLTQNPGY